MKTYSKTTLIGHVGSDVILRTTTSGTPVVNLRVATNEHRKDGPEVTTWHRVVLWNHLAELASRYLKKGEPVYVEGRLGHSEWVDTEGVKRVTPEVTARDVVFLGGGAGRRQAAPGSEAMPLAAGEVGVDGEEMGEVETRIPF